MGTADIIPGVSGGTIALISGIYDHLIQALSSPRLGHIRALLGLVWLCLRHLNLLFNKERRYQLTQREDYRRFTASLLEIQWAFLIPLLLGIVTALIVMSRVVPFLMSSYPFYTFSFFFGLIAFSVTIPFAMMRKAPLEFFTLVLLALGTFVLVGYTQLLEGSASPWYVFFSGAIAICAMILPGISGAFILVILGQYALVLSALRDTVDALRHFDLALLGSKLPIVAVFVLGVVVGIFSFVRVLRYLLANHHSVTMAALTGIMLGSLRKLWPFAFRAEGFDLSGPTFAAIGIAIFGAVLVFGLERLSLKIGDPEPPVQG